MPRLCAVAFALTPLLAGGCRAEKSARGFYLPDGDAEAGRAAFVDLKCHSCHQVIGAPMAAPTADPPVPVVLGGRVASEPTDGELVTSIVNPSHRIDARPLALVTSGSRSRMGDYSEAMTIRQLIDLVAFLHDIYVVPQPEPIASQ